MSYHRREDYSGTPMLVKLPTEGYVNTGEGGLAFYFAIPKRDFYHDRCVCLPGGGFCWGWADVVISPLKYESYPQMKPYRSDKFEFEDYSPIAVDGGMLIGSTGLSLWNEDDGEYFHPKVSDLTPEGKRLYHTLKRLYGNIDIVTLLDT